MHWCRFNCDVGNYPSVCLARNLIFTLKTFQNSYDLRVNQWDVDPCIADQAGMLKVDVPQVAANINCSFITRMSGRGYTPPYVK